MPIDLSKNVFRILNIIEDRLAKILRTVRRIPRNMFLFVVNIRSARFAVTFFLSTISVPTFSSLIEKPASTLSLSQAVLSSSIIAHKIIFAALDGETS